MSAIQENLHSPAYYPRSDDHVDYPFQDQIISRIFYSVLPFLALHKPLGRVVTLTTDSIRVISKFSDCKDIKSFFHVTIAVVALSATFFMHPLGLCITGLYNLGFDLSEVLRQLQAGSNPELFQSLLSMSQHLFYIGTISVGSIEIIAISLLLNMAIEAVRSRKEFQKGRNIEAISHVLMSVVRFSQALPYAEQVAKKHVLPGRRSIQLVSRAVDRVRNQLSIYFYLSGRFFVKGMWKSTEMWLNTVSQLKNSACTTTQKVFSISKSTIGSVILLPFTFGGLALGQVCHFTAFLMATKPYIQLQGTLNSEDKTKKVWSFFQLNCCLTAGGFARLFGGLDIPNDQRVSRIAGLIRGQNPDIVSMQEVSDIEDAYVLYQELSRYYADFYFHMGTTPFILQNNSGLFVASKVPIESPEFHDFSDLDGTETMVNKGFFIYSVGPGHFVNTHLSPSDADSTRFIEQQRILAVVEERFFQDGKPAFVSGDLNIDWGGEEYQKGPLFIKGRDSYNSSNQIVTDENSTCDSSPLKDHNWHHRKVVSDPSVIDYFLSFFGSPNVTTRKVATYSLKDPSEAIADHAALISEISG